MNGFAPEWLAAREAWDHRARSPVVLAVLERWLEHRQPERRGAVRILDLGCGTGSTPRYLGPRIKEALAWTLVDGDQRLLEIAAASTGAATVHADLSRADLDLDELIAGSDLVTASALLDLVSETWLDRLWGAVEDRRAGLLAGLTYDGRIALAPSHPFDAVIRDLTNRHQRGDKGFGPALGPRATALLAARVRRAGWRVTVRRTDWVLAMDTNRPGLEMLLDGWAAAAREVAPGQAALIDGWRNQRRSSGGLKVTVGHRDLLALPPD